MDRWLSGIEIQEQLWTNCQLGQSAEYCNGKHKKAKHKLLKWKGAFVDVKISTGMYIFLSSISKNAPIHCLNFPLILLR